ncbi:MAG: antitoxin Xre/MbcA/ParS toxin-binding domain-containing protein [Verrucomicrobiota bacterium]
MSDTLTKRRPKKPSGTGGAQGKSRPRGGNKTSDVVNFCVHGPSPKIAAADFTPSKLIEVLRVGLPVRELDDLQASLAVPMEKLVPLLGISKATLHRRKAGGRLGPAESDRVVRFARLMGKAVEVLESEQNARRWLTSPQFGLGGAAPLAYAETEVGAREVEDLLGRIEHGVYS